MPVYRVSVVAPNGNRRTRVVPAHCADDAFSAWKAEIELESNGDVHGLVYEIEAVADESGEYENDCSWMRNDGDSRTNFTGDEIS